MGQRLIINLEQGGKMVANIYYHWSAYTCANIGESKNIIEAIDSEGINKNSTLPEIISAIRTHTTGANIDISERRWMRKSKLGTMPLNLLECLETMKKYFETEDEKVLIQAGMNTDIPDEIEEAHQIISRKNYKRFEMATNLSEEYKSVADLFNSLEKCKDCSSNEREALIKIYNYEFGLDRNEGLICVSPQDMEESLSWGEGCVDINIDDRMICNTVTFARDDLEEYSSLEEVLEKEAEFPCMIKGEIYDEFWQGEKYQKVPKADVDYIPLYEETTFEQYVSDAQIYFDFYKERIYEFQVGNFLVEMIE